ncbi:Ferredoxin-2 [Capsicum annuum]|nr:Ferredoxin-2 [Capsicum annuum]
MDLQSPCTPSTSLYRKPPLFRQLSSLNSVNFPSSSVKCRRNTTPKFLTPVAVAVSGQNGSSYSPSVPTHKVTVLDRQRGVVHEFVVPEDQYILHTAEAQNITLPFACRHEDKLELPLFFYSRMHDHAPGPFRSFYMLLAGCCTSCAVRVKSGQLRQPEALGISAELKSKHDTSFACYCPQNNHDMLFQKISEDGIYEFPAQARDYEGVWSVTVVSMPLSYLLESTYLILNPSFSKHVRDLMVGITLSNPISRSIGSDQDDSYQLVKGYALLCVGYPSSDLEVETQDEDEVYWLQFGRYFARGPIERDDYALELALGDE